MGETLTEDKYIARVFGVVTTRRNAPLRSVSPGQQQVTLPPPPLPSSRPPSGNNRKVMVPPLDLNRRNIDTSDGKRISITKDPNGKPLYTAPPPPVRAINFSGGGAKGAALPGALKAMQENGVLDTVTTVNGASVGAITAALVAAGISAEDFEMISNSKEATKILTDGTGGSKLKLAWNALKNKAQGGTLNPLTGEGMESLMTALVDLNVRGNVEEYIQGFADRGETIDPQVEQNLRDILGEMDPTDGPTFGQMARLSVIVPKIKQVQITGTYTTEYEDNGGQPGRKLNEGDNSGKLYLFNAKSEPDLPISVAVHASASFPLAFKPVNIKLSNGKLVRFIDGGTVNNTPTSQSLDQDRGLDPMPDDRAMTFIFETKPDKSMLEKMAFWKPEKDSSSKKALKGEASGPSQGLGTRAVNALINTANSGLDYGVGVVVTDRPQELIEVPLKLDEKIKRKFWFDKEIDERDGTLNFAMPLEVKKKLQAATEKATNDHIARENQPRTTEFESDAQMFCSIPIEELEAVADSDYPGARDAVDFRNNVAIEIATLKRVSGSAGRSGMAEAAASPEVGSALQALGRLAGGDVDFQGYIARELNKGPLDDLLKAVREAGTQSDILAPTFMVSDALVVRQNAMELLQTVIYPKLGVEKPDGAATKLLLIVQALLRAARSAADFNEALDMAIDHFYDKSDKPPLRRGHREFATRLMISKMPT